MTGCGKLARDAVYWHYPHYKQYPQSFPAGIIRAGKRKLLKAFETGKLSLYDLSSNIGDTNNLAEQRPAKVARLYALLKAYSGKWALIR